jgi:hypothetical protein
MILVKALEVNTPENTQKTKSIKSTQSKDRT